MHMIRIYDKFVILAANMRDSSAHILCYYEIYKINMSVVQLRKK